MSARTTPQTTYYIVFGGLIAYIQQDCRAEKLVCWDLIYGGRTWWEMRRCIQMRAVMFQHPKTSGEVAVFLDGGISFGVEIFFVAGPGDQLVVDCVTEIDHARFSAGYALQHRVLW